MSESDVCLHYHRSYSCSKAMSNFINPRTKVSVFGSLEGVSGGWAHRRWLDLCILSAWSPSCKTPWLAFHVRFYKPCSNNWLKVSDRLENMKCPRPRYRLTPAIAMQINHAQVVGFLNKAPLDPAQSCARDCLCPKIWASKNNRLSLSTTKFDPCSIFNIHFERLRPGPFNWFPVHT